MPDITIHIPGQLYKSYLRRARKRKRSIEDEVRETILEVTSRWRVKSQGRVWASTHLIDWRGKLGTLEHNIYVE